MPVETKLLPGEAIISVIVSKPFEPVKDVPAMFADIIRLRQAIQGDVALILDVSRTIDAPDAFSKLVFALSEASQGIRASKTVGLKPPITIFVGSGPIAALASQAINQEQYGGTGAHLCDSYDKALALAREKLSTSS